MRYVKISTASEDTVQLFDSLDAPVNGLVFTDVNTPTGAVEFRKEGQTAWSVKTMTGLSWIDRSGTTPGNYSILFSASDFDTEGLFRYRVTSVASVFKRYEDVLYVVTTLPTAFQEPPTINLQTDSPAGMSPDPVFRGTAPNTLTITGTELTGVSSVTVGGVNASIVGNTSTSVSVSISSSVPLGLQTVIVTTAGGNATGTVNVVLHPNDIPGQLCAITGRVFDPRTGNVAANVGVEALLLDMPVIVDGVAWLNALVTVTTNTQGVFSVNLPRLKRVEVFIPLADYRREFIVPDLSTANLFTEIPV